MDESDWHAHYNCIWCHGLKAKADIIFCDEKPVCKEGDCRDKFYEATRPRSVPRSVGYYDKG